MFNVEDIKVIPDERMKKIISEVFDNIIKKYNEKNFLRWINESKIDNKIKTLIVKYINLKEHPNSGGYYDSKNNTLAVQESYEDVNTATVIIHEFNHFLTPDNYEREMSGFINEGITEYLKQSVDSIGYKTYKYNVDFVAFLHKQIGDILIKSYFTGETSKVKTKLATYIAPKSIESLISDLSVIYEKCYRQHPDVKEDIISSKMDFFADSYMQIYLGKIKEDAESMQYYTDGNIDQKKIVQILDKINSTFPKYIIEYMNSHNLMQPYKEQIVRTILNCSHLKHFDYYEQDNIKPYVDAIMNRKTIEIPNVNAIQVLLLDKLKNKELDLNEYADIILMVVNKFPYFKIEYLNKMEFLKVIVGEDKFDIVYEYVKNNINRYNNINNFVNERERNTIESQFKVIVPNSYYLEKRDNKLYIIKMDDNCKVIGETPVESKNGETFSIRGLYLSDEDGNCCVPSFMVDEDFSKIEILPKVNPLYKDVYGLDDFQKLMKTMPFFANLYQRLKKNITIDNDSYEPFFGVKGVYYKINNSYISAYDDYRTIHIELNGLKKDLDSIISFFPKMNIEEIIISVLKKLIENTYDIKYSSEIDWCSKELYNILYEGKPKSTLLDIEGLLNNLKKQNNDFISSKYDLAFEDELSKQEYEKRKKDYDAKIEKRRLTEKLMKEQKVKQFEEDKIKTYEDNHRYGYLIYERKKQYSNPDVKFDLPGKTFPQKTREPGFATIDVEKLIKNMKNYISLCGDKKDYEPYITNTIKNTINGFLEKIDTVEGKELFDSLYTMIYNSIFKDEKIDIASFEIIINKSNKYISKHAFFWPTQIDLKRDAMFNLLNELYTIIDDTEQFEKIVEMVNNYIINKGYDEYIFQMISKYISLYNQKEKHTKK